MLLRDLRRLAPLTLLALSASCVASQEGGLSAGLSAGGGASPTDEGSSGSSSDAGGSGDDGGTSDDDDGAGAKFDVAPGESGGTDTGEQEGCKVDLLFVIDGSPSMTDNQDNLINSFPGFVEGIRDTLTGDEGIHVGVSTVYDYPWNPNGCQEIGTLITETGGTDSSNAVCGPFADGHTYMTENDDLETTFACAAKVGAGNSGIERQVQSAVRATSPDLNAAGACNEGFIRDDAVLVVVMITDEPDQSNTPPSVQEWFDYLVDRKGGNEVNVAMISFVVVNDVYPSMCVPTHWTAYKIIELTEMFSHGYVGDVCTPDYSVLFNQSIGVVESACLDFVPPG